MRDLKKKTKKQAGIILTLTAVLGGAFFLGNLGVPATLGAFSASDFASTTEGPPPIITLRPQETTTEITVDIFNPAETTTVPNAIGIIGEETTLPEGIITVSNEETTTPPEGIVTVSDTETEPPDVSISDSGTSEIPEGEPPVLVLTYYTFNLSVGQEAQVYWKVENATENIYTEEFSSDNPSVAAVSGSGMITARAAGTANVTVTWGDLSATAVVTVTEPDTAPPATNPPATNSPPVETVPEPVTEASSDTPAEDPSTSPAEVLPKVKLDGCLYDTKGEAMSSIMLMAGNQTAITDINGYFTFYDLDMGETVIAAAGNDRLACSVNLLSDATVFLIYNGDIMECCSSYEEMASRFVITKIDLEVPNKRIYAGDTVIPYYQYEPRDAAVTKTQYISSNENVARVDGNGVISAVAEGETVITIILNDGQAQTEFTLTVSPEEIGKYSGLIAAGETLLVLIVIWGAFVVYRRYKKRIARDEGGDDEDEE